jgi:hypothetical protein
MDATNRKTVYRVDSPKLLELWLASLNGSVRKRSLSSYSFKENIVTPAKTQHQSIPCTLAKSASCLVFPQQASPVIKAVAKLLFSEEGSRNVSGALPHKLEETVNAKRRRIIELLNKIDASGASLALVSRKTPLVHDPTPLPYFSSRIAPVYPEQLRFRPRQQDCQPHPLAVLIPQPQVRLLQTQISESCLDTQARLHDFKRVKYYKQLEELRAQRSQLARDIDAVSRENARARLRACELE